MDDRRLLARRIYETSNLRGEFRLRSGAVTNEYFDKYLFEAQPRLLNDICAAMKPLVPAAGEVDALAGLELGGVPIATVLSQMTGLPAVFVRKAAKEYGTVKRVEGRFEAGERVAVIEDIVTSGGAAIQAAEALREVGLVVEDLYCVVDREEGGRQAAAEAGLTLHPVFTATDLGIKTP